MHLTLKSACERVEHFQHALSLFKNYLEEDVSFQNNFLRLLETLILTERSEQSPQPPQSLNQHVFFIAVGKSAGVAQIACSMFKSVKLPVQFLHPTEAFHGDFGVVNSGDTVVFISNGGNSRELLQLVPGLKERSVSICTITAKTKSPLALKSDFILKLPEVEEKCPLNQAPITSTLTSLALCQLLVAASMEKRNFQLSDYAKNHPGGSIGKRIFLKVEDFMSKDEDLPVIAPHENFQTVVSIFTKFSKASLIVAENGNFLGLIAERDLRKSMEKFGPEIFQKTAQDIMNPNPTCIRPGILAHDAMQMMTQKKPYFNVLPVVTEQGAAVGLLQLQDLIAAGI